MTVHIVGAWELGWNVPLLELDLWEHPLRDFGVDSFHMSPVTGIQRSRAVTEHPTIEDALTPLRAQGLQVVYVDECGVTPLREFCHPADVVYVFGKASYSPMPTAHKDDQSVRVEFSEGRLWPHQAAVVVLYDRMCKAQP